MRRSEFPIYLLIIFFSSIYALWSVNRHSRFQTDAVDLAIFDQPLWHYSRFESPRSTVKYNQFPGEHILGDHFHPTLALLAPLYWLWDDVRILLIAQAVLAVFSVWPIYEITKRRLKNRVFALSLSFSYLTFIGFQTALNYDFHEVAIAILPFSFAIYFLLKKNYFLFALTALLAALTKEDMPLFIAMVGLWAIFKLRLFKIGGLTFIAGLSLYFIITLFLIPYFKHDRFAYEELDPRLGRTTFDLLRTAVINPRLVLDVLFRPILKTKTMLNLLGSYAFLPLLSPLTLILSLPNLAGRFLTKLSQRWLLRYQYNINLNPVLSLAVVFGLEDLRKAKFIGKRFEKILFLSSVLLILAPLAETYRVKGPLTEIFNLKSYAREERFRLDYELLSKIPTDPQVSVMAQSSFVPHLSHRYRIFRFEDNLIDKAKPDYVLMSAAEASDPPYTYNDLLAKINILRKNMSYEVLYWDGTRLLMKRQGSGV